MAVLKELASYDIFCLIYKTLNLSVIVLFHLPTKLFQSDVLFVDINIFPDIAKFVFDLSLDKFCEYYSMAYSIYAYS